MTTSIRDSEKEKASEKIKRDIDAFLESGGKIKNLSQTDKAYCAVKNGPPMGIKSDPKATDRIKP